MPPFYDGGGYQQPGYGQGQAYLPHGQQQAHQLQNGAFLNQTQHQQQQAQPGVPSMTMPSQQQNIQGQGQGQAQWQHYSQPTYNNYTQQFVPPPQHQNFQVPQQQAPQYQQSSPLQQFAAGQLGDSRHQQQQQQYWQQPAQAPNNVNQYQPIQSQRQIYSQPQPTQTNRQPHQQVQQNFRQTLPSSPVLPPPPSQIQTNYAPVNEHRQSQQSPRHSQHQTPQSTPISQQQQNVSSRPLQAIPATSQYQQQDHQHRYQRTPSQPSYASTQHPGQQHRPSVPTSEAAQRISSSQHVQTPRKTSQPAQPPGSTPNSRTLAHVHIPPFRPEEMAPKVTPQDRTAKRRRSNEGEAIHVSQTQKHRPHPPPNAYVQIPKAPESSPLTDLVSSQVAPPTPSPDVDYQSVLLSLSDEYVAAAHGMSAHLCSPHATEEELSRYHKLIATALGCLESVILNYRPTDARKEARVRLRFASLLFEETEDTVATEESLSKGIAFCERNRLTDTKYAMHHLLIRVIFKTNPKAATRTLEKLIEEVETVGATQWIYALRFLRVSLSMQSGAVSDASVVLRHLAALNEHAYSNGLSAVQIVAAVLESLVHLQSGDRMAAEQASRSLTLARTHQLENVMAEIPQLRTTMEMIDLACIFLQPILPDQTSQRMQQFHHNLDQRTKGSGWPDDGSFVLPLGVSANSDIEADTGGILRVSQPGDVTLAFMWLSRRQLYMMGYLLGGIAFMSKNGEDRKSETFLAEGLKLTMKTAATEHPPTSIREAEFTNDMQQRAGVMIKLLQVFAHCARADWAGALPVIQSIQDELTRSPHLQDEYTKCSVLFLHGACKQGMGELVTALELYRSPELSVQSNLQKTVTPIKDLQILAALSSVSILRLVSTDSTAPERILTEIAPYCESHPNKSILAAYHLLQAHLPDPSMTIIKVKQSLQSALKPAQGVKNIRIMAIIMNTMTSRFFDGIVGKQAINGNVAGKALSNRSKDPLWMSVSEGMYRDTLLRVGDVNGAAKADQEFRSYMAKVPAAVQSKLLDKSNGAH